MLGLIRAELARYAIELKNYYPDQIVDVVIKYILFVAFFSAFAPDSENTVYYIGYLYWIVASGVISEMSMAMSSEKQIGTVEHIMIMPNSLLRTLVVRTYIVLLATIVKCALIVALISLTLPVGFSFNLITLITFIISLIGFTGIGLALSGLTMKFAKVASFESLISYGLLLVSGTVISFNQFPNVIERGLEVIPFTAAILISQQSLLGIDPSMPRLLALLVQNIAFAILGYVVFKIFFANAKSKGIANNY